MRTRLWVCWWPCLREAKGGGREVTEGTTFFGEEEKNSNTFSCTVNER